MFNHTNIIGLKKTITILNLDEIPLIYLYVINSSIVDLTKGNYNIYICLHYTVWFQIH